jgi:hypothetical protein
MPYGTRHPYDPESGVALITAMVLVTIVASLGLAVLATTTTNVRMARLQLQDTIAFNVAESGADRAIRWLHVQPMPPTDTGAIYPFGGGGVQLGEGRYYAVINPDAGNPGAALKTYIIVSVGVCGAQSRSVQMVVRQSSFGKYAYFTDYETFFWGNTPIWFKAGEVIDGPAHSNNTNDTPFNINWVGSSAPIFLDTLTCCASYINWSPRSPQTHDEFDLVFADGEYGYRLGVDPIDLPESTAQQKEAAWGSDSGFPGTNGVYLPNAGGSVQAGVYIRGDAQMWFSVYADGDQGIRIKIGSDNWYLRIDTENDTTQIQKNSGGWATYSGIPNGAVYCTGDVTSLEGEVADNYVSGDDIVRRNAYTIATDVTGGKYINITNNLYYHTLPDKTKPPDDPANLHAGTLGLVARNVKIDNNAPPTLKVHATIMAGGLSTSDGSFYVNNWDTKTPVGTLTVLGGIIQKKRGPVGTFNATTGQSVSGYMKDYHYDPRMADNPPPFFPTTGNYERISWRTW